MKKMFRSKVLFWVLLLVLALPLFGFQIDPDASGAWLWIGQVSLIVGALLGGGGIVWLTNRLKELLNLSGLPAMVLSMVVSVIVAVATLVVEGAIGPDVLVAENFAVLFLLVWTTSQRIYETTKDE